MNQFQTYVVFNQPCFNYPSYPSFYLACLPTSHLESYDRLSSLQLIEGITANYIHEGFAMQPSMQGEEGIRNEDSNVSF
jgi:hypothetical protein